MLKAAMYGKGRENLHKALSERLDFTTGGSLKGERWDASFTTVELKDLGRLNSEESNRFFVDFLSVGITYVVWSYDTPIAWVRGDGTVYRVEQRFTVTTSKHQGAIYPLG
jgi:hypothetical protein